MSAGRRTTERCRSSHHKTFKPRVLRRSMRGQNEIIKKREFIYWSVINFRHGSLLLRFVNSFCVQKLLDSPAGTAPPPSSFLRQQRRADTEQFAILTALGLRFVLKTRRAVTACAVCFRGDSDGGFELSLMPFRGTNLAKLSP